MSVPGNSFDKKGFFFTLRLCALFALIATSISLFVSPAHFSTRAFVAETYSSLQAKVSIQAEEAVDSTQPLEEIKEDLPTRSSYVLPAETIEQHIPKKGKFIGADLVAMKLYTYEDGKLVGTYDVLSKGRPGSRWETPSGKYSIQYKNQNHFSSIGSVYMPYSMQFFGNFFIHGWPYYPGGAAVEEGFSGGCIRLSTKDAEEVYLFSDLGTPLFVYDTDYTGQAKAREFADLPLPRISAESYLVADVESGEVFIEHNPKRKLPIASITKLMTAVVSNESIGYNKLITLTPSAIATYGTSGELEIGEQMYLKELTYPLLLNSSNDAATAIGEYLGTAEFVGLMNKKAEALGMKNTSFKEPSGLSEKNVSTSEDLFKLVRYIWDKKKFIFDTTTADTVEVTSQGNSQTHTFRNIHPFKSYQHFVGGKNGYTDEAQKTLISLFDVPIFGKKSTVAVIVLKSKDYKTDTGRLVKWLMGATNLE